MKIEKECQEIICNWIWFFWLGSALIEASDTVIASEGPEEASLRQLFPQDIISW